MEERAISLTDNLAESWINLAKRIPGRPGSEAAAVALRALAEHLAQKQDKDFRIEPFISCMYELAPRVASGDAAFAASALADLTVAKGSMPDFERKQLVACFDRLAARLAPADASKLARDIVARFTDDRNKASRRALESHLSLCLGTLTRRLSSSDLSEIIGPLIQTLAGRVRSRPQGLFDNVYLLRCLGEIATRSRPEDEVVIRAAALRLASQAMRADSAPLPHYADAFSAVAGWLDPSELKVIATKIADELDKAESWRIGSLVRCLVTVSAQLNEREARAVSRALANRAARERDPENLSSIAEGVVASLRGSGSTEATSVVSLVTKVLADRLAAQTARDDKYSQLGHQVGEIGRLLGPAKATEVIGPAVEVLLHRLADPKVSILNVENLAERLSLLGCRVEGELAQQVHAAADVLAHQPKENSQKISHDDVCGYEQQS